MRLRVEKIIKKTGKVPVLATILVGNDPSSEIYVKMKGNACERVGMTSLKVSLPQNTTTEGLLAEIEKLNNDDDICGILLQHPVHKHINERVCFDKIAIDKDVDGVTCLGFGPMTIVTLIAHTVESTERKLNECSSGRNYSLLFFVNGD